MSIATGTTERETAASRPQRRGPAGRRPVQRWLPWTDGAGRFSALKLTTFAAVLVPAALLLADAIAGNLGPRPWNLAIHRVGWWTVVFLMASLTVTPLRRTLRWNALYSVRRMVGVTAFVATVLHLVLYAGELDWNLGKVTSEIVLRIYLTIGFVALLGLAALAATSTDGMVRRLGGRRWQSLHKLVYPITILALVHFFMQTKADVTEPILFSGLFVWLMAYRLWRWRLGDPSPAGLVMLALAAAVLTAAGEVVGISIAFHAPPTVVAQAQFDFDAGIRPAWWVLAAGLAVAAAALARRHGPLAAGR